MARKRIDKNLAYDDAKKLYYAYFDYGRDGKGNRLRNTKTFHGETEARLALLGFESKRLRGKLKPPSRMTLGQWLEYWLEDVVAPNRAYTTYYGYRNIVDRHVGPGLGEVLLSELAPLKIQRYYTETMRTKGLSPNTVHKHHVLLHTALQMAFRQGILTENPVDRVEAPREMPAKQLYYTPEQLRMLFQAVEGSWLEIVVKLGGYLGLRRGEICGLRWEHVDIKQKIICIQSVRTTAGGKVIEKAPKTQNSARKLGIGELEDLNRVLQRQKRQQEAYKAAQGDQYRDLGYILAHQNGTPLNPNWVSRQFHDFIRKNNLPPITLHGLRHTFASVANSMHVSLLDIGKALGHKDVSITGRIYTHLFDQTHQAVIAAVAAGISLR